MDDTLDPSTRKSQLFAELSELHGEARREALNARTADEPELRAQLEAMLALLELEPGAAARPDAPRIGQGLPEGMIVAGRYRLVRPIGRGGISVVYLAHEVDGLKRELALKLLAPGLEAAGLARFEGEKNALARMNHPNIARILEAGFTEVGQAFVAMEHIDGKPIDVYCREHELDLAARLLLFVEVCHGVAHAHQKGVIHRDLKPTNVLVTTATDGPHVKVIDFGIAKSLGGSLMGGPAATQFGYAVGTPGYMSPEQCAADGRDVDTTSDVYSLGVLLYELLTGSLPHVPPPPHRFDPQSFAQRLMSARVEPMSARLQSLLASRPPSSEGRVPTRLAPGRLAGDLDIIAQKALSPNPEDRYHTVSELAADIERHLRGEPILARPPSLGYLLSSLVRRRKHVFIAASLGLLLVVGLAFVMGSLVAAEREAVELAQQANERAAQEERIARERAEVAREESKRGAIASAQAAVQAGNAAAARRSLERVPEVDRQWEWHWLARAADQSELVIDAHRRGIRELALSADETVLATLGEEGDVALWDTDTGEELWRVSGLGSARFIRYGLAFSMELGVVVSSDHGSKLCAFDLATRGPLWCLEGRYHLQAESLAPDGRLALATGEQVVLVDALTGHELGRFATPSGVDRAAFPDPALGELLLIHGGGRVFAYQLDGPPRLMWWRHGLHDTLDHARRLYIGLRGSLFWEREVVSIATGELVAMLIGEPPGMPASSIGPGVEALGSHRGSVVVIRDGLREGAKTELLGHRAHVRIARSFRGGFWTGDEAGQVRRWSDAPLPMPAVSSSGDETVFAAAHEPGHDLVITAGWGMVKAWDLRIGRERWSRWVGRDYLLGVDVADDRVVAASVRGELIELDLETGEIARSKRLDLEATEVTLGSGGAMWLGGFAGEVAHLVGDEPRWRRKTHGAAISELALSPGGELLAVAADRDEVVPRHEGPLPPRRDGSVWLLDAATGEPLRRLSAQGVDGWLTLRWSPDGRQLIGGGYQSAFAIWDLETAAEPVLVPAMGLEVRALAWSNDGERIFSSDENGTVQVWNRRGEHVLTLPTCSALVHDLFVEARGESVIVVNNVAPLVVYDPRPASLTVGVERRAWARSIRLRRQLEGVIRRAVSESDVAGKIAEDPAFAATRREALAVLEARGTNPNRVNSDVWEIVRYPGERRDAVRLSRQRAEDYAERFPRWEFENTRAFARLRDEDFEGAASSARESIRLGELRGIEGFPAEWAILSLVASHERRQEEALSLLRQAESALALPRWRHDGEARSIVDEAAQMLGRETASRP